MAELKKKRILLAEDDASMRRFIEVVLQQAGYEIFAAEDGLAAMQLALENEIDAVVADAVMPNLSGYDLCRMLRANPQFAETKLLILSGLKHTEDDFLADAYLLKGTSLKEDLIAILSSFLQ